MRHSNASLWVHGRTPDVPVFTTKFELEAGRLGLAEQDYSSSPELLVWIKKNVSRRWVPEGLLSKLGIPVVLD